MTGERAQNTLEYAIFFALVIAALVTMQIYFRRSLQGSLHKEAEKLSDGALYAPGAVDSYSKTEKSEVAYPYKDASGEKIEYSEGTTSTYKDEIVR